MTLFNYLKIIDQFINTKENMENSYSLNVATPSEVCVNKSLNPIIAFEGI